MTTGDFLGLALFGGFGLWWLVFPESVIRFYTWFHGRRSRLPRPVAIRVMGAAWFVFVTAVVLLSARKRN
jgi:succinate-acetate transporter protein